MRVNFLHLLLCFVLIAVLALVITSTVTRQLDVEVQPNPLAPTFRCRVILFFYNRRTECPGLATTNYRTPRDEGFFECVAAWDKWQTAFAFSIIACVFAFVALLISGAAAFMPPSTTTHRVRAWIVVALCAGVLCSTTISWPLVRSQITEENCGRDLRGLVLSTFTTVTDPTFAYGHTLGIVGWGLSISAFIISIVAAVTTRNVGSESKSVPVVVANDPAALEQH